MQKTFRDQEGNLVEVVSVEVAPHAGGISRTLTRVAFSEQFVPAEDRVYRQVQVTLEEPADLSLLAYWNGTRWHGWPVPELPLSSIRQLAQRLPDVVEVDDSGAARVRDGEEVIPVATTEIEVDGHKIHTYCIDWWCWELATAT